MAPACVTPAKKKGKRCCFRFFDLNAGPRKIFSPPLERHSPAVRHANYVAVVDLKPNQRVWICKKEKRGNVITFPLSA
jgi:hypothetical protein